MIWREHKLIFLHIPRTGGTSLESAICQGVDPLVVERKEGFWNKHFDAYRAEAAWPLEFHDPTYMICTILRNPLELVASQYIQSRLRPTREGFNGWLRRVEDRGGPLLLTSAEVDGHMPKLLPINLEVGSAGMSQSRFLESVVPRDMVYMSYDRLGHEITSLLNILNLSQAQIPAKGVRQRNEFPHLKRTGNGAIDYDWMYCRDTRQFVETDLAKDFELMESLGMPY